MDSTLAADPNAEPSAEEIARMQAEMQEWYVEAEKTLARMDERRPEIDRLRAETQIILDSLSSYRWITPEEWDEEKAVYAQQIAEKDRQIAEANQELARLRMERDNIRRKQGLPPASGDFWNDTVL